MAAPPPAPSTAGSKLAQRRRERRRIPDEALAPGALFALLTGLYLATMPAHGTLEDSGAFITVAHFAGIAHPPGYPLYTMIGTLFSWLPAGSGAFRVQLVSALAGALACVAVYYCV